MILRTQTHHLLLFVLSFLLCCCSSTQARELHNRPWGKAGSRYLAAAPSVVKTVNVDDYGAKCDGNDDTAAFRKAWEAACNSSSEKERRLLSVVLVVPTNNTYILNPITFQGPCKSVNITVQINGTLLASADRSAYGTTTKGLSPRWLVFQNIPNLSVQGGGGGVIDGNGKTWWENYSCKKTNDDCKKAPTALTFDNCSKLVVNKLHFRNSQKMHLSFRQCVGVRASGLNITSPADSPNTDGIHVTGTRNIHIKDSSIGTGDDCISIVSGSRNVLVTGVACGPGHGISIGSLGGPGGGPSSAHVSNVTVAGATLSGTTNGVRIKTWRGGAGGEAADIQFRDIAMRDVKNPIIIDQTYCDEKEPAWCRSRKSSSSAVQVRNVLYRNITGTSSSEKGVVLNCSDKYPCRGIVLQDIHLEVVGEGKKAAKAVCNNAGRVILRGKVSPNCSQ